MPIITPASAADDHSSITFWTGWLSECRSGGDRSQRLQKLSSTWQEWVGAHGKVVPPDVRHCQYNALYIQRPDIVSRRLNAEHRHADD